MSLKPLQIGPYLIDTPVVLAPMAGVTDKPFRMLCKRLGAGLCVSEMTTSDPRLWHTSKSVHRMDHVDEPAPISVQIAGTDPQVLAEAARYNVDHGAQIIDINMGCPAKKVCNVWAGSALMRTRRWSDASSPRWLHAVDVPVTLKIRTGWNRGQPQWPGDRAHRRGLRHRRAGRARTHPRRSVHGRGRVRDDRGDQGRGAASRCSPTAMSIRPSARASCSTTRRRDAVMVGRAAQGRPWIFREIAHFLATGEHLPAPTPTQVRDILIGHLRAPACVLWRTVRRAHRPQAPGLVREGPAGERGLPRRGQSRGKRGRADPVDARLFRRAVGTPAGPRRLTELTARPPAPVTADRRSPGSRRQRTISCRPALAGRRVARCGCSGRPA